MYNGKDITKSLAPTDPTSIDPYLGS
jgi:hypothetical protein